MATRHACTQIFSISEFEFQINQHAVEMLTLVQCVRNLYISGIPQCHVESAYQCDYPYNGYISLASTIRKTIDTLKVARRRRIFLRISGPEIYFVKETNHENIPPQAENFKDLRY